jgi:hypothetical protein
MAHIYYQVGGFGAHIKGGYDINLLGRTFAGDQSPLRVDQKGVELVLGVVKSGATYVLITGEQARAFNNISVESRRPPCEPNDFESLSPIFFTGAKDLSSFMSRHKTKNTGGQRGTDNSQANRHYIMTNGNEGILRGAFEHSRVLFRIFKDEIDIRKFSIHDLRWMTHLRMYSLVFNTWARDERPKQDRLENPKLVDIGWTKVSIPDLRPMETVHYIQSENTMFGQGPKLDSQEFLHGTSETISKASISQHLSDLFLGDGNQGGDPIILLVNGDESTRYALRSLGIDVTAWKSGIKELLLPKTPQVNHKFLNSNPVYKQTH